MSNRSPGRIRSFFRFSRSKEPEGPQKHKSPTNRNGNSPRRSPEVLDFKYLAGRFPWAKEKRVFKRENFNLTLYHDGSRLYTFKDGGYMIMTPEGVALHKTDPQAIKRYLKGNKIYLRSGGNSDVFLVTANQMPVVFKEFRSGVSADGQMRHAREAKQKLNQLGGPHNAPTYYGMAAMNAAKRGRVREVGVMEFVNAKNVSDVVEELRSRGDSKSMKSLSKLLSDYKGFKRTLEKKRVPLTDFDTANVLAKYDDKTRRYIFTLIDQ